MSLEVERIRKFVSYAHLLRGDEKGEAQVYCDRLFQAFGHQGYKEAGATLEERIRKSSSKGVNFADLVWRPRLIMEMKKKREKLHLHYRQAFDYWINCVPSRPRYVVLCNFDEFSIYDFDKQIDDPVDHVELDDLPLRYPAFNFLFPIPKEPHFNNDREDVSRKAADKMAELYKSLVGRSKRTVPKEHAQRFVLQTVVSMFAEDIDLLPANTIGSIVDDCRNRSQNSYDLFNGLFSQMNNPNRAFGGRYEGVQYFNGGLFSKIYPIELTSNELDLISGEEGAANHNWSKVNPSIFGTLFQDSMDKERRHALGAHFTSEADIQRIVGPTIVRPWQDQIDNAKNTEELIKLRRSLMAFRVLDPACGSGNFLYVSFREMARLDIKIMLLLRNQLTAKQFRDRFKLQSAISAKQFFGIDIDEFGVELAKVTLMLAKKLSMDDVVREFNTGGQRELSLDDDAALPLDNLDSNIVRDDALFAPWPDCDVIIGNPPYQSKNKIQRNMAVDYLHQLRERFPTTDGRADYCVHWFRLAHDHLKPGDRAGLVGTNTIRQNYSREAGTDYIIENGGTITEAVSSMVWPGEADLHVSLVNWTKGKQEGVKRLYLQEGNDPDKNWYHEDLARIGSSLSFNHDVTKAAALCVNSALGGCFQGQTHGHKAFLLNPEDTKTILTKNRKYEAIVRPFMIADDLIGEIDGKPSRYAIDFSGLDILAAQKYKDVFDRVKVSVLPARQKAFNDEKIRNAKILAADPKAKVNHHHENFLNKWWLFSYPRSEMKQAISTLSRYIVCGRVTLRPIFEFICPSISPNDALQVFTYEDDYSFGILQSNIHWSWFTNRCSTLTERFRYTSNTVFDSFPWPQSPSYSAIRDVANASRALRLGRNALKVEFNMSFRELYRSAEMPGAHPLKQLQANLDNAVASAYGLVHAESPLPELLSLNLKLSEDEANGIPILGPGLPEFVNDRRAFITDDMIVPV